MNLSTKKNGPFSEADLELITLLGRQMGLALEKSLLEEKLRVNQAVEKALDHLHSGFFITDVNNVVVKANDRAKKLLEISGHAPLEGMNLPTITRHWPDLAQSLKTVLTTSKKITRQQTKINDATLIGYSCVPVKNDQGSLAGAAIVLQDLASLTQNN